MNDSSDTFAANRAKSSKSGPLSGKVRAPGDKSMSHRSLILGAMAKGTTTIDGLLEGDDILSTASAMRAFGAKVKQTAPGSWSVKGRKAWLARPESDIDCGNAGTGVRLIMGAAAGYKMQARFIGDESLSSRPMARIINPITQMGAKFTATNGDQLPVTLDSDGKLKEIEYITPKASAQIKSAVLLAGINTQGRTVVIEKPSRDHTENMLRAFGCGVKVEEADGGRNRITIDRDLKAPNSQLQATHIVIPGDPSSAAFAMVAGLIVPGSDIVIENVMMNPTRTGLFETLVEMGGWLRADNFRKFGGEVIADINVKHSRLRGVIVPEQRVASMVDEYPILTVAAAFAAGKTVMDGLGELRVKESDRISATVALLKSNGVVVEEREAGMTVTGLGYTHGNDYPRVRGGGYVITHHDHRIAMSALILGLMGDNPVSIDDASMIATSFPEFFDQMQSLGAKNLVRDAG